MPVTKYFWDPLQDNVTKEYDENRDTIVRYATEPGLHGDLISQERDGATSYYHFDGQGNTLALTNEAGEVTDEYAYNAFGETTEQSGTTENSRRYVGEKGYEYQSETGGYYVRAREYEPTIGRWLSLDPVYADFYIYANNSPLILLDPTGLLSMRTTKTNGVPVEIGPCGQFTNRIKFFPADKEHNGLILQHVRMRINVESCNSTKPPTVKMSDGTNDGLPCGGIKPNGNALDSLIAYWEVWRIGKDGGIYIDNVFDDEPTKNVTDAVYHDQFSFVGFATESKGCIAEFGEVYFIPEKVWKKYKPQLKAQFKSGASGAANAGVLYSLCSSKNMIVGKLLDSGESEVLLARAIVRSWTCSCCGESPPKEENKGEILGFIRDSADYNVSIGKLLRTRESEGAIKKDCLPW